MTDQPDSLVRTAATFGIIIGGPVTLFTGIALLSRIAGHTPRILVGLFLVAGIITVLSILAFVTDNGGRRP